MVLSLWSENSAKVTLFFAPKDPKMLPTDLIARASCKTAIAISLQSLGWVGISILIFDRYLEWAKILISAVGRFCQKQSDMALRYGRHEALPTHSGESRYVNVVICIEINKPAAQAAGQTLPDATPPVGKIHPFSKNAGTFEPIQRF